MSNWLHEDLAYVRPQGNARPFLGATNPPLLRPPPYTNKLCMVSSL